MKKISLLSFLLAALFTQSIFLSSCSTDIDLLEEYQPITVVYTLLDKLDTVQYLKINKAFLGKGNAMVMAEQYDSTNYQAGDLDYVKLLKINPATGAVIETIYCIPTTTLPKDTGTFFSPDQLLYRTPPGTVIDENFKYNLEILRHSDGEIISSSTLIVKDVAIQQPSSPTAVLNLANASSYFIRWQTGANGKIFNSVLRIPYLEYNPADSVNTASYKYVDWNLGNIITGSTAGNLSMTSNDIGGEEFVKFMQRVIPANPNLLRHFGNSDKVEIIISAGAEDLYTYIQVNAPSIGLIQEKPIFTNISNGYGIFSSRWNKSYFNRLSPATCESLRNGRFTGVLFDSIP